MLLKRAQGGHSAQSAPGATVIIRTELPREEPFGGEGRLSAKGPGIQDLITLNCDKPWWLEARNDLCAEFPLGIDIILLDDRNRVEAFPRSTALSWEKN